MAAYDLDQVRDEAPLPDGIVMKALVRTSGDTVGLVFIGEDGGFILWRNGAYIGTFATPKKMYRKLDWLKV